MGIRRTRSSASSRPVIVLEVLLRASSMNSTEYAAWVSTASIPRTSPRYRHRCRWLRCLLLQRRFGPLLLAALFHVEDQEPPGHVEDRGDPVVGDWDGDPHGERRNATGVPNRRSRCTLGRNAFQESELRHKDRESLPCRTLAYCNAVRRQIVAQCNHAIACDEPAKGVISGLRSLQAVGWRGRPT